MTLLILSHKEPKYQLARTSASTSAAAAIVAHAHAPPRPKISNQLGPRHSLVDWKSAYDDHLAQMCNHVYEALCLESENMGYSVSVNKVLLYKRLSDYMYTCSSNVNKRFIVCK